MILLRLNSTVPSLVWLLESQVGSEGIIILEAFSASRAVNWREVFFANMISVTGSVNKIQGPRTL